MNKHIKKIVSMLLACFFLLDVFSFIAHAEVPAVRIKEGKIKFDVTSTAATSGIRYKTTGWTIRRDSVCMVNSSGKHCDPTGSGSAVIEGLTQIDQYPNPPVPGEPLTTSFEVSETRVTKALTDNDLEGIQQNDQLYLYAIMIVTQNGSQIGGPYYTLDGIKKAQSWAHPDDLDDYFGIPVTYDSPDFPVDVVCKTETGTIISDPACSFHKGDYKAGVEIEHTFDQKIEVGGKTYEIVRSYIVSKHNLSDKKFVREIGESNLLDRHISVYLSGVNIIAEYKEQDNPVKAIYQKEDGTKLKEVDKGKFATGAEATHTFEAQLVSGGKTYEIIRSYITDTNDPNTKRFVQEKADPKLRERSITVASGGSNFVGIYKIPSSVTVTSRIEAPTQVSGTTTEVNGDFLFDAKALTNLKTYEITSIQNASLIQSADRTGTLSGTSAAKSVPIRIPIGSSSSVTVNITVVVKDVDGNIGDSTSDHTVQTSNGGDTPTGGTTQQAEVMDPNVAGVIKADLRGAEKFDVVKGIPTSESLYVNASSKGYLYRNEFTEMSGTKQYPIQVSKTYTLTWTETRSGPPDAEGNPTTVYVPRSDTQTVAKSYSIERKYSYWQIQNLEVYGLQKATFANYALPSGTVTLQSNGYTPPNVSAVHEASLDSHITHPVYTNITLPGQTISGGSSRPSVPNEDWKSEAERAIGKIKVKNDSVVFNGMTVMDNRTVEEKAPAPGAIPAPTTIEQDVLYGKGYLIDSVKTNKANQASSGTIFYTLVKGINGGENKSYPINGINAVTVHTPIVNTASVSDDQAHNQKTKPSAGRSAFILDRPFTVTVPTSGPHRDITGYGNRDYVKYTKDKQVWFPFDTYSNDKSTFYPKETWISLPVTQTTTTFFLPVWVDEGNYDVLFRTFAENSPPASFGTQMNANLEISNHVATLVIPVEVVGRLYDFRITDIADYSWETVFRTQKGSAIPTGKHYWVGAKGIDGAARGNSAPFVLPVRQGSNPNQGMKNIAVKTGYHFKFDLKTKGNMFGSKDGIKITPTFYFVDAKGKNRQQVDLYYHTSTKKFIRIGSSDDVEKRYVTLDARLRNVPQQEMVNTAGSLWSLNGGSGTKQTYIDQYLKNAKKQTYIGGYDILLLPQQLRTFIGNMNVPSGVNAARANASVQQWYGEYSLPAAPYVVPKGTNLAEYGRTNRLDDKSPVFLKDGYIIVNFNIETIRNQDVNNPHLQYINAPLNNQWQMEGFQRSFTDPYGMTFQLKDGDIVFYHANLSSYDDFGTGGTH
ncbi:DUF5704 domain-containing protein [Paenibacillus antri]|uniref:DUF5704 domain-containing protein n=1 Tax=Paenibacillus antri TaxID=2582848 RepID=UPI001EE42FA2|nr:DUF5704 domain-containing protein [Paenibacillus antri]